ncbi:MAG: hypothetical protein WAW17_07865 [Rhodococcus sp. (in: high G+C Gram-positive bacteria)]|uniref:hypothetical protein n=1 Tax=Rhodococcus sp. TaxID=1831 RepID=UPI003BB13122
MTDTEGQMSLFEDDAELACAGPDDVSTTTPETPIAAVLPDQKLHGHDSDPSDLVSNAVEPQTSAVALPRASTGADNHAIIVTAEGSFAPSGSSLTGPVDSITKLGRLIDWASAKSMLTPRGGSAQIWILGLDACEQLGWVIDIDSLEGESNEDERQAAIELLDTVINDTLHSMIQEGWEIRGKAGHRIHLLRTDGTTRRMVDIVLEPYAWTTSSKDQKLGILGDESVGTVLPDEDMAAAQELGRRIAFCVEHLGVLPANTAARTGAAIVDQIAKDRKKAKRGAVATTAGPVPPLEGQLFGDIEPEIDWVRRPEREELDGVSKLVTIDQRASYLASAGMLNFGLGEPRRAPDADTPARSDRRPFGLWRVILPAGNRLALPTGLPLPHPHMDPDRDVQTWVTTIGLNCLTAPIEDGGAGLDVDDLGIDEAWLWPEQARMLEAWAKRLREARAVAVDADDAAMKTFIGSIYKDYVGRMKKPEMWQSEWVRHHHQPVWRASIQAMSRWRGRRAAMRIAAETGRWPIRSLVDSWVYVLADGEEIADESPNLGKMALEKIAPLTPETIDALAAAENRGDIRAVLTSIYNKVGQE